MTDKEIRQRIIHKKMFPPKPTETTNFIRGQGVFERARDINGLPSRNLYQSLINKKLYYASGHRMVFILKG